MNFIKLVINELVKNLKKKSALIFFIFSIIAIIVSCFIVKFKDYSYMPKSETGIMNESTLNMWIDLNELRKANADEEDKELYQEIIDLYKDIIEKGYQNILNASYKNKALSQIVTETQKLCDIDKDKHYNDYIKQKEKINKLKYILYNGTYEDYIGFNKEQIENDYKSELINLDTYNAKIKEQDIFLEYGIDKYSLEDTYWRTRLYNENQSIDNKIETRIDFQNKIYITDERLEHLQEDKLINTYRLKNNIAPYYTDTQYHYNEQGYMRYRYNSFANYSSMLFVGILIIILSASTIAEEKSKGTIKFLLINPNKRYKILLAKIVSILLILIATTLIISQISVIVGNVAFGTSTNDYLYVSGGQVKVMDTHIYETLQYLLKIPEIFIYMLFGITLSTLIRNTAISTVICTICYVVIPFAMKMLETFISLDFLRFLPFRNFEFISQVLRVNTYETLITLSTFVPSVKFSVSVLLITAILLIITMFESFNKRDI